MHNQDTASCLQIWEVFRVMKREDLEKNSAQKSSQREPCPQVSMFMPSWLGHLMQAHLGILKDRTGTVRLSSSNLLLPQHCEA